MKLYTQTLPAIVLTLTLLPVQADGVGGNVDTMDDLAPAVIECREDRVLFKVNCSGMHLRGFPKFPNWTKILILSDNEIDIIGDGAFKPLLVLEILDLSFNKLRMSQSGTFLGLEKLKSLDLSHNKFRQISKGSFLKMSKLKYLDVSYNTELGLDGIENVTNDLVFTSIRVFKFQKIKPTFCLNEMLMTRHIQALQNTSIREVYADSNRLQLVERGAVLYLPKTLEKISIGDNWLSYGDYILDLSTLPIKELNVSFLDKSHDPFTERFDIIKDGLVSHKQRQSTFCSENPKSKIEADYYEYNVSSHVNFFTTIYLPKNLHTLYYSHCKLQLEIPKLTFGENNLEFADMSSNIFYSWNGPVINLTKLAYLDLSNNFCSNVSNVFFSGAPSIKSLYLQNNLLGFILPFDINGDVLSPLKQLEELDLSENRIADLPYLVFRSQTSIRYIFLRGNMIDRLNFKIAHMKNLSFLDFSFNSIRYFNLTETEQLETLAQSNQNLSVDLSGNPVQCTCQSIEFLQWMVETKIHLKNLSSYRCQLVNLTKTALNNPQYIVNILKKECTSYLVLILAVCFFAVLLSVLLTTFLIYRFTWRIQIWYYMRKLKANLYRDSNEVNYEYDCFISYADEDLDFVTKRFLPNLEKYNFRFCLHTRDFVAGMPIAENIANAIVKSKKTVCIISNNFTHSDWCMKELEYARRESLRRYRDEMVYLVLVYLESLKSTPRQIMDVQHYFTYIEFPHVENDEPYFWESLKKIFENP